MKPRPWDSTHPHNLFDKSLEERVAELEKQSQELVAFLKLRFPKAWEAFLAERYAPKIQPRNRGPKPRVSDAVLVIRRHNLIWFLEEYWPELSRVLTKKISESAIGRKLEVFTQSRLGPHVNHAQYLINRLSFLVSFIRSHDYTGDPRQIANAMAGVPENALSTSLKRCRAIPCEKEIGVRALRDYLRRNFPGVHAKLLNAKDADSVVRAMAAIRTTDREFLWLRNNPEDVFEVMRVGSPKELWVG